MPVAIETVIIIIVVISFAVLGAVVFALYWLWRLLLEDRRCARLSCPPHDWQRRSVGDESVQRALLTPRATPNPRISRRREVFVDERSRRMRKNSRCCPQCPTVTQVVVLPPVPPVEPRPPDVVVLDGTVPPPPYEDSLN